MSVLEKVKKGCWNRKFNHFFMFKSTYNYKKLLLILLVSNSIVVNSQSKINFKSKFIDCNGCGTNIDFEFSGWSSHIDNHFSIGIGRYWESKLGIAGSTITYKLYAFSPKTYGGIGLDTWLINPKKHLTGNIETSIRYSGNNWRPFLCPELGFSIWGVLNLTYSYTIGNIKDFYPEHFSRSSINLKLRIPISGITL